MLCFALNTSLSDHGPHEVGLPEGPSSEQKERPIGGGESRAHTVWWLAHDHTFSLGVGTPVFLYSSSSDSEVRSSGPSSCSSPKSDEAPGPPLYQKTTGAFAASTLDMAHQ
jgi:hypothetical protein